MPVTRPPAEIEIDEALVRRLLAAQHPDLADRPLRRVDEGWDNALYRLGDDLAVRLPRRALAVELVEKEQRWLPRLEPALPMPVSAPHRRGAPGAGFPWPWSIVPWLDGATADVAPPRADQAEPWAAFLRALHRDAPADAPHNPFRAVPLAARIDSVEARLDAIDGDDGVPLELVRAAWRTALAAPAAAPRVWIHADLHALNVVVDAGGALAGVIDWGDLTAGDPAIDVASIWMLFDDAAPRARCLDACAATPSLADRARGWAVYFGTLFLETGRAGVPRDSAFGRSVLGRVAADAG